MNLLCEIIVPAKTKYLRPILKTVLNASSGYMNPSELELVIEEATSNILNHSGSHDIEIRCFSDTTSFNIEITDCGVEFDMTAHSRGEELTVGGYGVRLIKTIMDKVTYRRQNNMNILRLSKSVCKH